MRGQQHELRIQVIIGFANHNLALVKRENSVRSGQLSASAAARHSPSLRSHNCPATTREPASSLMAAGAQSTKYCPPSWAAGTSAQWMVVAVPCEIDFVNGRATVLSARSRSEKTRRSAMSPSRTDRGAENHRTMIASSRGSSYTTSPARCPSE